MKLVIASFLLLVILDQIESQSPPTETRLSMRRLPNESSSFYYEKLRQYLRKFMPEREYEFESINTALEDPKKYQRPDLHKQSDVFVPEEINKSKPTYESRIDDQPTRSRVNDDRGDMGKKHEVEYPKEVPEEAPKKPKDLPNEEDLLRDEPREPANARPSIDSFDQNDQRGYEQHAWVCTFDNFNDCGVKNDVQMGDLFQLKSGYYPTVHGRTGSLYLNVSAAPRSSGARLVTDYFAHKNFDKACLTIDYMLHGEGAKKLTIYQQDTQNHCLWSEVNRPQSQPGPVSKPQFPSLPYDRISAARITEPAEWRTATLTVKMVNSDPRFFIEAQIDGRPPNNGEVAISKLAFDYKECRKDDANHCKSTSAGRRRFDELP